MTAAHATARQTGTAITLKRDEINALLETGIGPDARGAVPARQRSDLFHACSSPAGGRGIDTVTARYAPDRMRATPKSRSVISTVTASRLAAGAYNFSVQKILNAALLSSRRPLPEHFKVMRPFLAYECTIAPHDGPGILSSTLAASETIPFVGVRTCCRIRARVRRDPQSRSRLLLRSGRGGSHWRGARVRCAALP